MGSGERTLYHRWRDGERDSVQLLSAYAFLLSGVMDLYEATLDADTLDFAIQLADSMMARFCDRENGGFWQSGADSQNLILRAKEDYDGAEPSGNAVATLALGRLAEITAAGIGQGGRADPAPLCRTPSQEPLRALPHLLIAAAMWMEPRPRVVIAGDARSPAGAEASARGAFGLPAVQSSCSARPDPWSRLRGASPPWMANRPPTCAWGPSAAPPRSRPRRFETS